MLTWSFWPKNSFCWHHHFWVNHRAKIFTYFDRSFNALSKNGIVCYVLTSRSWDIKVWQNADSAFRKSLTLNNFSCTHQNIKVYISILLVFSSSFNWYCQISKIITFQKNFPLWRHFPFLGKFSKNNHEQKRESKFFWRPLIWINQIWVKPYT